LSRRVAGWLALICLLNAVTAMADPGPSLGRLIRIEDEVLIIAMEDDPEAEPQQVPVNALMQKSTFKPGMLVRVWPRQGASGLVRVTPLGANRAGGDLTGVRRRLSRGSQGGRGGGGAGGRSGGGGGGGR
jgi:hypothetical protein